MRREKYSLNNIVSLLTILTMVCLLLTAPWQRSFASQSSLTPTRVVIPAKQRSASVTIKNTSDTELAYRLDLLEMGLDQHGTFRQLNSNELHPDHRSAKPIIRFSPKQVRLKPGASQIIRVIVRRGGLSTGEYRSHMMLASLPVLSDLKIDDNQTKSPVLIESSTINRVGMTIPVIVRHGSTEATVTLEQSEIVFSPSGRGGRVELQMGLSGNRTAHGDFVVSVINGKKEKTIGRLNSFALYYPYPEERVTISLEQGVTAKDIPSGSKLRVRFKNKAIDSDAPYWLDTLVEPVIR